MNELAVRKTKRKGRGVFALRPFRKGELIESCPVVLFPAGLLDTGTILEAYPYSWSEKKDAFVLGYGSIYNHSYSPNAIYMKNRQTKTIDYYAYRDISAEDEVVVNYNGEPTNKEPLWFKAGMWGGYSS
jgi:SET domain-containing protein